MSTSGWNEGPDRRGNPYQDPATPQPRPASQPPPSAQPHPVHQPHPDEGPGAYPASGVHADPARPGTGPGAYPALASFPPAVGPAASPPLVPPAPAAPPARGRHRAAPGAGAPTAGIPRGTGAVPYAPGTSTLPGVPAPGQAWSSQADPLGGAPARPPDPAAPASSGAPPGTPQPWAPPPGSAGHPGPGQAPTTLVPAPGAVAGPSPHRTGSPVIPPGIQPAGATAGLCLLIALTALLGRPGLAFAVVVLQAVTAAGWFRLNGMWPARQGIALAFAAGLTADAVMLALDGEHAPATGVGALGVWCLLILVLQLRHRGAADERLYALTVAVSATVVTVLASGFLAAWSIDAPRSPGSDGGWSDGALVVIGAVSVGVAAVLKALPLPLPEPASAAVALVVAAGAGASLGGVTGVGTGSALVGLAAGGAALLGLRVASYDWPSRFVHFTAGVALPVTAAAPAVWVIGRVLTG